MTGTLRLYDRPSLYKTETRHNPLGRTCYHFAYHGLTCDEFDAMRARCDGRCEICRIPEEEAPRGRLLVDHCERGGYHLVRGLLCSRCNAVMGCFDGTRRWSQRSRQYEARARDYDAGAWWKARYPQVARKLQAILEERMPLDKN